MPIQILRTSNVLCRNNINDDENFIGFIDLFRIYERELSNTEI
jgi:hypothetical protein